MEQNLKELKLDSGETLVYLSQQIKTDEDIVPKIKVLGYKMPVHKGVMSFLIGPHIKLRTVSEEKKQKIRSNLLNILKDENSEHIDFYKRPECLTQTIYIPESELFRS